MVAVPNMLVRLTRYMTRSAIDELFHTIGLDKRGSEQHFKVVYDLLSQVKNIPHSDD